jgi:WhiB family redox-sensing transcriptional regulator
MSIIASPIESSPPGPAERPAGASPFAEDWWTAASCRTHPRAAELFFSDELADLAAAKHICAACPVIEPCLEGAISRHEPCGVWGGQLFENGRIVLVKRRRGRPPKHPRVEDQLPMIPVPAHLQRLIA